ncbi:hypothetical protein D9M71_87010 [compost metagenome]
MPNHCNQRAAHHQQGTAHAAGVEVDDRKRSHHGQAEEHHHLDQAVDQVAHQFGKTDHTHLVGALALFPGFARGAVACELYLVAQLLFDHSRELLVVDALAGSRGLVQQWHDQHSGFEVAGHQAANKAGTADVLAQTLDVLGRTLVGIGHHRATLEALLGDFSPAYPRAPQRFHPDAVDAFGEEQLIIDLLEDSQVVGVENIALGILDHYPHRAAQASQRLAVLQEVLDVRLALRNHFLKAGAQFQATQCHVAQHQGGQRHQQHEQRPIVEYQPFQAIAGASVEITQVSDHRHGVLFDIAHVWVLALNFRGLVRPTVPVHHDYPPSPASHPPPERHRPRERGPAGPATAAVYCLPG